MTETKPSQRTARWIYYLAGALVAWSAFVVTQASSELHHQEVVKGLIRDYHPPYEVEGGWVIDPSTRGIADEVRRRFSTQDAPHPTSDTPASWVKYLEALSLGPRAVKSDFIDRVHLRFSETDAPPDLWIGHYGVEHVLYRSGVGVMRLKVLPPSDRLVELTAARFSPW